MLLELDKLSEEELIAYRKKIEEDEEDVNILAKKILRKEEEEEERIYKAMADLEQMEVCAGGDTTILFMIEEQKRILAAIRGRKAEFVDEFKRKCWNKVNMMEEEISEINQKIRKIQFESS